MDRHSLMLKTIRGLYDAVLSPELDLEEFSSLCRLVDGEHLIFFTEDLHANRLHFAKGLGVDSDYFRRLAIAVEAKIMPPGLLTMPVGTVKLAQSLWVGKDFDKSAFYNEVVRPDGGHHGLLAAPFRKNRYGAFLAIERLRGDPDFDEADAQTLQAVLPHLTNSMLLRLKLEEAQYTSRQSYSAFDLLDFGVFIVDADLRPHFVNKYGEGLIGEADGLSLYRGRLQAANSAGSRALRHSVRAAIALRDTRRHHQPGAAEIAAAGNQLSLARPSKQSALSATVMPLGVENIQTFLAPPMCAIVFVKKPGEPPSLNVDLLEQTLGLTPRQAMLTALLAQGVTLAKAAATLGLAVDTVRWHLKEIFEKTNTHRQVDLVRLALQIAKRNELS